MCVITYIWLLICHFTGVLFRVNYAAVLSTNRSTHPYLSLLILVNRASVLLFKESPSVDVYNQQQPIGAGASLGRHHTKHHRLNNTLSDYTSVKIIYLHSRCYHPIIYGGAAVVTFHNLSPLSIVDRSTDSWSFLQAVIQCTSSCYSLFIELDVLLETGIIIIAEHQVDWFRQDPCDKSRFLSHF